MADRLVIAINTDLAQRIREHGARTYPYECCGALLGRASELIRNRADRANPTETPREVLKLFPLANGNGESPRNRFLVTANDVRKADVAARNEGLEVIGWYHSHPDHPARPSDYDRDHAWPWYSYIIVSVHAGTPQDMTSWRLEDDRSAFAEEKIAQLQARAAK